MRAYSKGNRQKILLIAALMTRPDLLVLDEPTSGLDPLMEQAFRHSVAEARQAGQTVFLSSHILSEVEALCDRVGILREGRLVEMGTLAEMRHLSALSVEATFGGAPPDLAGVAGVKRAVVDGRHVHLEVQGPIEPLVDALAGTGVRELLSREPSLEELFLAHYGPDGAAPVLTGASCWCGGWPMTGGLLERPPRDLAPAGGNPGMVVAGLVSRRAARSGALWGLVFGFFVVVQTLAYTSTYKTQASRDQLAHAFGTNIGLNALLGQAHAINTVAGWASWRFVGILSVLGSIWGLLISTRLLRGDEEAGRYELLLAGQTTRRRAGGQAVAGLGAGLLALFVADRRRDDRHRPLLLGRIQSRPVPLLLGHARRGGGHVPRHRRAGQPAGRHPPARRLHGRGRLRHRVRPSHGGRLRPGPALAGVAEPARLDRGIPAADRPAPDGTASRRSSC